MFFSRGKENTSPYIENSHPRKRNILLFFPVAFASFFLAGFIAIATVVTVLTSY